MQRIICMVSLLFCIFSVTGAYTADEDEYLVIKLDDFSSINSSVNTAFTKTVAGDKIQVAAGTEIKVPPRLATAGNPLQVVKSYVPDPYPQQRDASRSIAGVSSTYVPEIITGMRNSFSSAEYIDRMFMELSLPLSDNFILGGRIAGGVYDLVDNGDEPALSAGLLQAGIAGLYKITPELSVYADLMLGSTNSVVSPGINGRISYQNRGGIGISLSGSLWVPWDENTYAVYNNGRSSGVMLNVSLPLSQRLQLDFNAGSYARYTAESSFEMSTYEGTDLTAGARLNWDFFKKDYRQLPVEFASGQYLGYETQTSHAGLFVSVNGSEYFGRTDSSLIPVTTESLDQRVGLSAAYAFTSRLAALAEIYVGYDPARDISFGKLYGFYSRLVYIPAPRLRVYGEFALDSEAATGLEEGRTWYYGVGVNYKF